MHSVPFSSLPDDARLWALAAPRPLSAAEAERVLRVVDDFLADWRAHGQPVRGARALREQQFLFVAADERATGVSGCSLDALFRVFKALEQELGVPLGDAAPVWYRTPAGEVASVSRAEFRARAARGEVGEETPVFDLTIATVGELRAGAGEKPAGQSWQARLLRPRERVGG